MNLNLILEQQVKQDQRMVSALRELLSADSAAEFIRRANFAQCKKLVDALAERVIELEGDAFGLDDVYVVMQDALDFEQCTCGKCDSCVASRSDEHHDRKRDGGMMAA